MYLRIFKLYSSSFTYNIYKCLTSKLFVWYLKISICNKEGRVCDNVSEIIAIMKNNPRMIDVRGKTIFLTNKVSSSRWRFAIQIYLLESTISVNDYNFFFFFFSHQTHKFGTWGAILKSLKSTRKILNRKWIHFILKQRIIYYRFLLMTMNDNEKPLAYLKYCDQILPFKNARHRRSFFFSLPYYL